MSLTGHSTVVYVVIGVAMIATLVVAELLELGLVAGTGLAALVGLLIGGVIAVVAPDED
ncbi:MAG: hypothetical protein ACR2NA_13965 [Solirubrobacterales bacterium]